MAEYSVLMAVYKNEVPENFRTAILSMVNQEVQPSEMVIVCDGPLTEGLDAVLAEFEKSEKPVFNIIRLPENKGLANALNIGLQNCKYEYVLRMDSDDIALSERSKYELEALDEGFDIVGGYISEFDDGNEDKIIATRKVPLEQKDIYEFIKKRSPFNHPSVAYRKSFILSCGNYDPKLRKTEDWDLWVRCILNNAKVRNFDKVFVKMRSGKAMRKRRGGKDYIECQTYVLKEIRDLNWITDRQCRRLCRMYRHYATMPAWIKNILTKLFLR